MTAPKQLPNYRRRQRHRVWNSQKSRAVAKGARSQGSSLTTQHHTSWRQRGHFPYRYIIENLLTISHTFYYGRLLHVTHAQLGLELAPPIHPDSLLDEVRNRLEENNKLVSAGNAAARKLMES